MRGDLLPAARAGDERAFVELTSPSRDELHRHCYRLLGSTTDADDALQETMLRAWQAIGGFEPRAPLRSWLYRIATNVCLRHMERRPHAGGAAAITHLEPYAVSVDQVPSAEPGPEAIVEAREAIGLAFVAAMQLLPARQRVVLVLRDVLGWPSSEVADVLGDSVASVNSALNRARVRLAHARAENLLGADHRPSDALVSDALIARFIAAWEAVDIPSLVALRADDAVLAMPPEDVRIVGAAAIGDFFATQPLAGRLDQIPLLRALANGQPVLAAYADTGDGAVRPYGMMVLSIVGDRLAAITGFPERADLYPRIGLPTTLEAPPEPPAPPGDLERNGDGGVGADPSH